MTTLERPPEEEKELHEYIFMQLQHSYLYWDVFKRQKTEDKLSKKKKTGQKINIDCSFANFIPRPKEKTPITIHGPINKTQAANNFSIH